jgi:hypothetical protein
MQFSSKKSAGRLSSNVVIYNKPLIKQAFTPGGEGFWEKMLELSSLIRYYSEVGDMGAIAEYSENLMSYAGVFYNIPWDFVSVLRIEDFGFIQDYAQNLEHAASNQDSEHFINALDSYADYLASFSRFMEGEGEKAASLSPFYLVDEDFVL